MNNKVVNLQPEHIRRARCAVRHRAFTLVLFWNVSDACDRRPGRGARAPSGRALRVARCALRLERTSLSEDSVCETRRRAARGGKLSTEACRTSLTRTT